MRIALAQINYHIGNFEQNTLKIIQAVEKAKDLNSDLIVFSELAISGYPANDFLEFDDFISKCDVSMEKIALHCTGIAAIVGTPVKNHATEGKRLFNSAAILQNGKLAGYIHKSMLSTYDIFDESRYFEPNRECSVVKVKGKKIALTIYEDLWDLDGNWRPMRPLMEEKPDFMVNIAASPFSVTQIQRRKVVLSENVSKYDIPLVFVNHVGAQAELLFDGNSMVIDRDGTTRVLDCFEEDFAVFDLNEDGSFAEVEYVSHYRDFSEDAVIHNALVMGIRDYFMKLGFKKAILGLSGGIDSAVTMVIAAEALGAENVIGLILPSQFSTYHSVDDALGLAKNLGSPYHIIPIKGIYDAFEKELKPHFEGLPFNITEENIQARSRAVLLMAFSNKFGHILLNTSNKSEAAVGYGTLYGDMCGGMSVLGDVYKTKVFDLARYINRNKEIIPWNTITKPPSAELRPDQFDSDSLPDYDILDAVLFHYIEDRKGSEEITAMGFDAVLVKRIIRMVNMNEYKRYQTSPVLRITDKAFGMGRRMPIVAKYFG